MSYNGTDERSNCWEYHNLSTERKDIKVYHEKVLIYPEVIPQFRRSIEQFRWEQHLSYFLQITAVAVFPKLEENEVNEENFLSITENQALELSHLNYGELLNLEELYHEDGIKDERYLSFKKTLSNIRNKYSKKEKISSLTREDIVNILKKENWRFKDFYLEYIPITIYQKEI